MFGGSVTIIGMLMMAVAVLLFLFSIRQFLIAKKMRHTEQNLQVVHCLMLIFQSLVVLTADHVYWSNSMLFCIYLKGRNLHDFLFP